MKPNKQVTRSDKCFCLTVAKEVSALRLRFTRLAAKTEFLLFGCVLIGSSGDGSARRFCSHCIGDDCHDAPLPGHHYWAVGEDCSKDHSCDCNMMMPADAFAICVWALVMASVLAPIGFSVFLKRRLDRKAQQADELKQSRRALRAAKAPPTEAEAAMPSTSSRP